MDIEIKLDSQCITPKIVIHTADITPEVQAIAQQLSSTAQSDLIGFQSEVATILTPGDIFRLYTENKKVYAETEDDIYAIRLRLYEAENILDIKRFARISHSEIINLQKIKNLDLSLTGTICVNFKNGKRTYVSRRYVTKIKSILGL